MKRMEIVKELVALQAYRLARGEHREELLALADAALELLTQHGCDLDLWEADFMAGAVSSMSQGWYSLARANLMRALVPPNERAQSPADALRDEALSELKMGEFVSALQALRAEQGHLR